MPITALPTPPSRQDPANFPARSDEFLSQLPTFAEEANALQATVNQSESNAKTQATNAASSAASASNSASAANTSANNAALTTGAQSWVSGTTYAVGTLVYSTNGRTYRRRVAGAGTTAPQNDATNWSPVILEVNTSFPTNAPKINFDFINSKRIDPRLTCTRQGDTATVVSHTAVVADENLLRWSEQYDNSVWFKGAVTMSDVRNVSCPVGAGSLMTETTASGSHYVSPTIYPSAGKVYTMSVFAKAGTESIIQIVPQSSVFGSAYATYNLSTGVVEVASLCTASMTDYGSGWYLLTITTTAAANGNASAFGIHFTNTNASASRAPSYTGTGKTVYLGPAQVEARNFATDYVYTEDSYVRKQIYPIVTVPANTPRIDHDPVTGERKGLLVEQYTLNGIVYSEDFDNAYWSKGGVVVRPNAAISPDGLNNATLIRDNSSTSSHGFNTTTAFAVTAGNTITYSVYVKPRGITRLRLQLRDSSGNTPTATYFFNTNTWGVSNSGTTFLAVQADCLAIPVGNGWFRLEAVFTMDAAATDLNVFAYIQHWKEGEPSISYTGDGYSGFYYWGAMLQANSNTKRALSYVKSDGVATARSADLYSMNVESLYNPNFSFIAKGMMREYQSAQRQTIASLNPFGLSSNLVELYNSSSSRVPSVLVQANNSNSGTQGYVAQGSQIPITTPLSIGVTVLDTSARSAYNGIGMTSDTTGSQIPYWDRLQVGTVNASNAINGWVQKVQLYSETLTQDQLNAITAV